MGTAANEGTFTPPTPFSAEGARAGLVTCRICGAAVLMGQDVDALTLHNDWHGGRS